MPGDYDGDGLTDVAVYRPSTGAWMLRTSGSNYALTSYTWGVSTDMAVPGDYDGDGRTDVAVFRPSTGSVVCAVVEHELHGLHDLHVGSEHGRHRAVTAGTGGPRRAGRSSSAHSGLKLAKAIALDNR